MKIIVTQEFDYDLGGGMTLHALPSTDPVTVKREVGVWAVEQQGFATDPAAKRKTVARKAVKPKSNDDAGQMGGSAAGQTGGPDTAADDSINNDADDLASAEPGADLG